MSLRLAVLALLDLKPASGYSLLRRFQNSIGFFWQTTHQQLYKELHSLHAEGLLDCETIVQSTRPDKNVYRLNPAGQIALTELLAKPAKLPRIKDDFLVKLFAGRHLPTDSLTQELSGLIEQHQQLLATYQQILVNHGNMPIEHQQQYAYPIQTLKWGIHLEQSWLDWAQQCLQDLQQMSNADDNMTHQHTDPSESH
ncbi:MAG: PadR family transcriptional regulator [Pseudomonadota bacterium]|nr:PadR family transcriptional regulator [Pseudomonadota bacterium]